MIIGERILEVRGDRVPGQRVTGLNLNISIDNVEEKEGNLEIEYTFTAEYQDAAGSITIKGVIITQEDDALKQEVLSVWKEKQTVPGNYAATILSAVNYSGSANGTLIARVLGLNAPFVPPKIQIKKN